MTQTRTGLTPDDLKRAAQMPGAFFIASIPACIWVDAVKPFLNTPVWLYHACKKEFVFTNRALGGTL
jgi:hypothetical protein